MDYFSLDSIVFPVYRGELCRFQDETGTDCWNIEIYCHRSEHDDFSNWSNDEDREEMEWIAGTEPYLYGQMLPFQVESPEHLIGRTYHFPQSPNDESAEWDRGVGWLFFCLYLFEHDHAYPMTVSFVEQKESRYLVRLNGSFPYGRKVHELQAEAWLDWVILKA